MSSPCQLALDLKPRSPKGRGGARPGAGRPRIPDAKRGYVPHRVRPALNRTTPAHVTLRLRDGRPSLRRKEVFRLLREAVKKARLKGLEVVHFAILSNHIHLLLEPKDARALGRAIQSLAISFAKKLNRQSAGSGAVFAERYHLRLLRTPTETRYALAYVLSNEGKHQGRGAGTHAIGPFSSGFAFEEWQILFGRKYTYVIATDWSISAIERWLTEVLVPPRTWLLREGWRRGRMLR